MRFLTIAGLFCVAVASSYSTVGTNVVANGKCEDGRQWFVSIEVDDSGKPNMYQGLTCDGVTYKTSTAEIEAESADVPQPTVKVHDAIIEITMNKSEGRVTIHDVYTRELIHDLGAVSVSSVISKQVLWGRYIVVTRAPLTGKVTDSELVLVE